MGTWGIQPYESDGGLDWFCDFLDESTLAEKVEQTLAEADPEEDWERIWAACDVLHRYGKGGMWPSASLRRVLQQAAELLIDSLETPALEAAPDLAKLVDSYATLFESRLEDLMQGSIEIEGSL